jgi:hypothetical protein
MSRKNWLSIQADSKTVKGEKLGFLTAILYLAPAKTSGVNMCPWMTVGCEGSCLFYSGRAEFTSSINAARIAKTREFMAQRENSKLGILRNLAALSRKAQREALAPAARLNGTADLRWEAIAPEFFASFPNIRFYDYTKDRIRYSAWMNRDRKTGEAYGYPSRFPKNYHLTFSRSERDTDGDITYLLAEGGTVAVPYSDGTRKPSFAVAREILAKRFNVAPSMVVNGDESDVRFMDKPGSLILLAAKGAFGRADQSGFTVRIPRGQK